ncbi:MAG: zinc-dependent metalloprotease [Saprospiraceae bacterium]|nr:zinc-dependent metalloprotease [Saprospiraceae bacterium]
MLLSIKMIKNYALLGLLLAFSLPMMAQQPADNWCGTRGKSEWLKNYQRNRKFGALPESGGDTAWLYVPVTIQIVGNNNGTNYHPADQAIRAICEMNAQYEPARIRFYLYPEDGIRYLPNSDWYNHDWDGGAELIQENKIPGRLNAFIVGDPAGNCGYSWYDAIVLGRSCSASGNTTWAHEAGHHLSLPHPFYGWEGHTWNYSEPAPLDWDGYQIEKKDGSNCYDSADGFCDTEPDYLNFRWPCNDQGRSQQLQHDPNDVPFRSDATLFMGYASDACAGRFTPEQIAAMRENLRTEHSDYLILSEPPALEIPDDEVVNLVSPIDSAITQYNNINLRWNTVPNARYYTVEIGMNPEFFPRLYYKTFIGDTTAHVSSGILNNRVLYWKVRAFGDWDVCQPNDNLQLGTFTTRNLTSTNDLASAVSIELQPNPVLPGVESKLLIQSDRSMDMLMSITDASGRICYRQEVRISEGENALDVPSETLSAGFYLITLQNPQGILNKRLVVCN